MKKILAALLAVVMIVSCMSVAFAESTTAYVMESKGAEDFSRWRVKITSAVMAGDKVSFWVKPVAAEGATAENADMYVRVDAGENAAYYLDAEGNVVTKLDDETGEEENVTVYSGKHIADYALKTTEDGWYYIECQVSVGVNAGYELSVDAGNVSGKKLGACEIADVKVNGEAVEIVAYNTGAALETKTVDIVPVVVEETEDVTEGTEETGVVSVAIVAVAAVIGGAVVLKKREF